MPQPVNPAPRQLLVARQPREEQREDRYFEPAAMGRRRERKRIRRAQQRGDKVMPEWQRAPRIGGVLMPVRWGVSRQEPKRDDEAGMGYAGED